MTIKSEDLDYTKELILIVDDDPKLSETLRAILSALGFSTETAINGEDALNQLKKKEFSMVLTDMMMSGMGGMKLIEHIDNKFVDVSVIAMTGYSNEYNYVDVINMGASDFIKKPFRTEELEAKIRRLLTERNLRRALNKLSITDSLTNLYNQRHFYTRIHEEVKRAVRQKNPLSLILLDLDRFKDYNDTYGHLIGDEILRNAGEIINRSIRDNVDSGFRYGGDEFAIILIDADINIAKEIGHRIEKLFNKSGKITVSVGYALFSDDMTVEDLVNKADKDLYNAKAVKKPKH